MIFAWGKLLFTLASLLSSLINWFHENQLISEGEALEIAKALGEQSDSITKVSKARKDSDDAMRNDPSSVLRDDGHKRD